MISAKRNPAEVRPNLYLVGFMGTGKSTVGRAFARRMKMQHIDSDKAIETDQGKSIPEIFKADGEGHFRGLERSFVEGGHPEKNCVVSCGGGLVMAPGMIDELKKRGLVACLFASPDTILERTSGNANRPLLNVPDPRKRIRELLAEREPIYLSAGACFYTDSQPMSEVVRHLERFYIREARRFRRDFA
ncbi:MAG: shikimate kinase [Verrucomicrobiota bacterium]